jgi:alpha-galactosidase
MAAWERLRSELENPDAPLEVRRSVEFGSLIIHSLETGIPRVVYGNVANKHFIEILPEGCCVEVPAPLIRTVCNQFISERSRLNWRL